MKVFYAKDYGIVPGKEVAKQVDVLLRKMSEDDCEKVVEIEKGEYFMNSENMPQPCLYITNTIGDSEWESGEMPHKNRVGMFFKDIKNLTVNANSAVFTFKGQATNVAFINCENVQFKNIELKAENPDMHGLKVVGKGLGYVDFRIDKESVYTEEKGNYFFVGKDYKRSFTKDRFTAFWIGFVPAENPYVLKRTSHPFRGAYSVKEREKGIFRAKYLFVPGCKYGDEYYIFDVRRKYQGIFASQCKNLVVEGVKQRFNYGLANVYQDCENVAVKKCVFAPADTDAKKMASVADFIQVCCCRGKVEITDNIFCGAGDDCLNVHGIHFAVRTAEKNTIRVVFRHPQSHGFCPFRKGDAIRFVNPRTLLCEGENVVEDAVLRGENEIEIKLADAVDGDVCGLVTENADACPDVLFARNSADRIITRGLLLTTSGKVEVADNVFGNTSMNAILISDDAKSWYESGLVKDVCIKGNSFFGTDGYYLCVKPENSVHRGYVHSGIKVENNLFSSPKAKGLYFKSSEKCVVKNNDFVYGKSLKQINSDVESDM